MVAALVATLTALALSVSAATGQDRTDDPAIHGFPGARENTPGLYSWVEGEYGWMHRGSGIPEGSGSVHITFGTVDEFLATGFGAYPPIPVGTDLAAPYPATPQRAADSRVQVWRLDVGDSQVAVRIVSSPDTFPALLAEAEAIVESIRSEPADNASGYRLIFELPSNWDSG